MSGISSFRKKRDDLIKYITLISRYIDEFEKNHGRNAKILEEYKESLDDAWNALGVVYKEVVDVNNEEPMELADAQQKYCTLAKRLTKHINGLQLSASSSGVSLEVTHPMTLKLPTIRMPTFDGTIENWSSFYDVFHATIDQNNELKPVEKLHYLRSLLTERAAKSIESLGNTEDDYSNAIAILKETFHYPHELCLRHWNQILKYPKLKKETPDAIENLISAVNMNLEMMKNLGHPITSDVVIIGVLLFKLDSKTIDDWELSLPNKNLASYSQLLDFLRERANCTMVDTAEAERGALQQHHHLQQDAPLYHANTMKHYTPRCPVCGEPHRIWNCDIFRAKSVIERIEIVNRSVLCANCLCKGHMPSQCFIIRKCYVCGERHHTLLHLENKLNMRIAESNRT